MENSYIEKEINFFENEESKEKQPTKNNQSFQNNLFSDEIDEFNQEFNNNIVETFSFDNNFNPSNENFTNDSIKTISSNQHNNHISENKKHKICESNKKIFLNEEYQPEIETQFDFDDPYRLPIITNDQPNRKTEMTTKEIISKDGTKKVVITRETTLETPECSETIKFDE